MRSLRIAARIGKEGQGKRMIRTNLEHFISTTHSGLLAYRHENLHVCHGKHARFAISRPLEPVVVDLLIQDNDVSLFEAQLAWVFGVEIVERLAARSAADWCSSWRANRRRKGRG